MRRTLAAAMALTGLVAIAVPATAQVIHVQLDATECFELQTGASCQLNPHTYPGAEVETGGIWTRDCDQTVEEGIACPFDFPPGPTPQNYSFSIPVEIHTRADFPGGNGLTTTNVCWRVGIVCRNTPALTTGPTTEEGEVAFDIGVFSVYATSDFTVKNTDATSFIHKFFGVTLTDPGRAGARCEVQVIRDQDGGGVGCVDDTPADVGIEKIIVELPLP